MNTSTFNPTFHIPMPTVEWKSQWRIDQERAREAEAYWKGRPLPNPVSVPAISVSAPAKRIMSPRGQRKSRRRMLRPCEGFGCSAKLYASNKSGFCKPCWTEAMLDRIYGPKRICEDCPATIARGTQKTYCGPCGKKHTNRNYKAKVKKSST